MVKDKQFLFTTILTIIGLVIPFTPNIFDGVDKNLTMETIKQTDLSPTNDGLMTNLNIYYSNIKINQPYLTEIKIKNTGTESILKQDFESPLAIELQKEQKIINATIIQLNPKDIPAKISLNENEISVSPMLFNADDYIKIQILTDNGKPTFSAHGRIKDIKEISLTEQNNKKADYISIVFYTIISILFLMPAIAATNQLFDGMIFRRRTIWFFMAMSTFGAEISIIKLTEELNLDSFVYFAAIFILITIISYPLGKALNTAKNVNIV